MVSEGVQVGDPTSVSYDLTRKPAVLHFKCNTTRCFPILSLWLSEPTWVPIQGEQEDRRGFFIIIVGLQQLRVLEKLTPLCLSTKDGICVMPVGYCYFSLSSPTSHLHHCQLCVSTHLPAHH
eukprot:TRINITY_DN5587_c0_g1_i2.p2 TRINITY_DN5587_c0_g1~~TRINITY_DN5587_c0_g1_i2.p2  ORF type:complete len:122 (+),score=7.37 TRINITY_DN5587_c0_g1_i2:436-801(+)